MGQLATISGYEITLKQLLRSAESTLHCVSFPRRRESKIVSTKKIITGFLLTTRRNDSSQEWIPAGVYPCENRGGNDSSHMKC